MQTRRAAVIAGISAVVLVVSTVAGFALIGSEAEGSSGSGFIYRDDFYGLSGAEVPPDRLRPVMGMNSYIRTGHRCELPRPGGVWTMAI